MFYKGKNLYLYLVSIYNEIYYKEWTHANIKVKKSPWFAIHKQETQQSHWYKFKSESKVPWARDVKS